MSVAARPEQLRNASIFQGLPGDALEALSRRCRPMELAAGETLFEQSDPGDALYILQDGQVHIVRRYENGDEVILATEGPYYVIGELSMLAGQPRTGGVVAVSDCTLTALSRDDFVTICDRIPAVATRVLHYLSVRHYRMNLTVREHAIRNVAARVASTLLLLSGGKAGAVATPLRLSRIARAAATDADVVERLFHAWVEEGYIAFDGQHITVRDSATLDIIAG